MGLFLAGCVHGEIPPRWILAVRLPYDCWGERIGTFIPLVEGTAQWQTGTKNELNPLSSCQGLFCLSLPPSLSQKQAPAPRHKAARPRSPSECRPPVARFSYVNSTWQISFFVAVIFIFFCAQQTRNQRTLLSQGSRRRPRAERLCR